MWKTYPTRHYAIIYRPGPSQIRSQCYSIQYIYIYLYPHAFSIFKSTLEFPSNRQNSVNGVRRDSSDLLMFWPCYFWFFFYILPWQQCSRRDTILMESNSWQATAEATVGKTALLKKIANKNIIAAKTAEVTYRNSSNRMKQMNIVTQYLIVVWYYLLQKGCL